MLEFILSTLMIITMIAAKMFFIFNEGSFSNTGLEVVNLIGLLLLMSVGVIAYIKLRKSKKHIKTKKNLSITTIFLFVITGLVVAFSLYLNSIKISLHWDAIALYEARAKFLAIGMKFSDMSNLSSFDNLNKHYYLLYPPFTSIIHFLWGKLLAIPISIYYSITLATLLFLSFSVSRYSLGTKGAALLVALVAANGSIFNVAIKEYTNLPYDLYLVGGILLLLLHLKTHKLWSFAYGTLLLSTSTWIRHLEPMWLAIVIAYSITILFKDKFKHKIIYILVLTGYCVSEYFIWNHFAIAVGGRPEAIPTSILGYVESVLGIFTGAPLVVAKLMVESWSIPFVIHSTALLAAILNWKHTIKDKAILFLSLILAISITFYFAGLYIWSFQVDWWNIIVKSLDRSAGFLIPVSAYIIIKTLFFSNLYFKKTTLKK